jgi:hypothetical protein
MVAPAFGFSVGDFIAAIHLVKKISIALKDSEGAADEYRSLYTELQQLQLVLEELRDLPTSSNASLNHYNAVRGMAYQVQVPLKAFVTKMRAYYEMLGPQADVTDWRSSKRKIQYALSMKNDVKEMRAAVTMKIVSVTLLLALPTR